MRVLMLFVVALLAVPIHAGDHRQMSGVVANVDQSNGMFTVRLDNGDMFTAPVGKVRIRDDRKLDSARTTTDSSKPPKPAQRLKANPDSVAVGSRVIVRRKLDRDGNLKRVTVRIVEQ